MPTSSSVNPAIKRLIGFAAILLLHAPFLIGIGKRLSGKEHYQFFPILIAGVSAIVYFRLRNAAWPEQQKLSGRVIGYSLIAIAFYFLGAWFTSHWMGTISFLVMLWAGIWYFGGQEIADRLRGPVFLLVLIIPLPLDIDRNLIISMQKTATTAASGLLDGKAVAHTVSGVAIRTYEKDFMVEDACSGIHSLFSGITVMVALAVIYRYSFIRALLTVLQTAFWILVANTARVFFVVYGSTRFGLELDSGWRHDVLSVTTYFSALALALSTDQLMRFVIHHDPDKPGLVAQILSGPLSGLNSIVESIQVPDPWSRRVPPAALACIVAPLFVMMLVAPSRQPSNLTAAPEYSVDLIDVVNVSVVPERIGAWRLIDRERVTRDSDDILGSASVIYTFTGNGLTCRFSIDGLFPGWHDLGVCYDALGWKSKEIENLNDRQDIDATRIRLYRGDNEQAACWFACYDSTHSFVQPKAVRSKSIRSLIDRLLTEEIMDRPSEVKAPVYQLQLICMREGELLPHEVELLQHLFSQLQTIVVSSQSKSATANVITRTKGMRAKIRLQNHSSVVKDAETTTEALGA